MTALLRLFLIGMSLVVNVGCISESNFRLSEESRLPKWFELPTGRTREDVIVTLHYYSYPSGGEAKLVLKEHGAWFPLKKVSGKLRGLEPIKLESNINNEDIAYEVLSAEGITDVIEHKGMNDLFYMSDDPAVWKELGVEQK